jgi:hypothetical protein
VMVMNTQRTVLLDTPPTCGRQHDAGGCLSVSPFHQQERYSSIIRSRDVASGGHRFVFLCRPFQHVHNLCRCLPL